jgi:hypothetical protein
MAFMRVEVSQGSYANQFEKEFVAAKKKAGRKVGKKIIAAHKRDVVKAFGSISKSHTKKLNVFIHPEFGGLVVADLSRSARLREYGGNVKGSPWLTIWFDKNANRTPQTDERTFTRRGRDGKIYVFARRDGKWTPVGFLVRKIRIPKQYRLQEHVAKYAPEYAAEIEKALIEGFK